MPITLYDAFVPTCRQIVAASLRIIDKAEAWAKDQGLSEAEIANWTLHETMLPFKYQVAWIAMHSYGAINGVRSGEFDALQGEIVEDFAGWRRILTEAEQGLANVTADELEAVYGRETLFVIHEKRLPFVAEQFLLSFSQPNFMFHATTTYDILRQKGLDIGKNDFLGKIRLNLG